MSSSYIITQWLERFIGKGGGGGGRIIVVHFNLGPKPTQSKARGDSLLAKPKLNDKIVF